jgi:hypothetical protein
LDVCPGAARDVFPNSTLICNAAYGTVPAKGARSALGQSTNNEQ